MGKVRRRGRNRSGAAMPGLLALALVAHGGPPPLSSVDDLPPEMVLRFEGSEPHPLAGLTGLGDGDGDGHSDMAFSTWMPDSDSFAINVVLGNAALFGTTLAPDSSEIHARLTSGATDDRFAESMSTVDDLDGDGNNEFVAGAYFFTNLPGHAYLIDSTLLAEGGEIALESRLGNGTFRFDTPAAAYDGFPVANAGDVDGDGRGDFLFGLNSLTQGGLVYGSEATGAATRSWESLDGTVGVRLLANGSNISNGFAAIGDFDGDGHRDFAVADPWMSGEEDYGVAIVVFGPFDPAISPCDVSDDSFRTMRIVALEEGLGFLGRSIAGIGDANGDGFADVAVSYQMVTGPDTEDAVCVVFGGENPPQDVVVQSDGIAGGGGALFRIEQPEGGYSQVSDLAGAGDVDGDGYLDFLIGASDNARVGRVFVVRGGPDLPDTAASLPSMLADVGFGYDGPGVIGSEVSGAGDADGDGLAEVMMLSYPGDGSANGYVVRGTGTARSATYKAFAAPGNPPPLPVGTVGDGTDTNTPWSRLWIDFATGPGANATPVTVRRFVAADELTKLPEGALATAWDVHANRSGQGARITLRYLDGEIAGADEQTLSIFRAVTPFGPWAELADIERDPARNRVSGSMAAGPFGPNGLFLIAPERPETLLVDVHAIDSTPLVGESPESFVELGVGIGDANGDSYSDMVVGAPGENDAAGAAYVVRGGPDFWQLDEPVELADGQPRVALALVSSLAETLLGSGAAPAGDVDGDGLADFVVSALGGERPLWNGGGYLALSSLLANKTTVDVDEAIGNGTALLEGGTPGGYYVANAGDVDGKGMDDLLFSFLNNDEVPLAFGEELGDDDDVNLGALDGTNGVQVRQDEAGMHFFGYDVAAAGDFNGDGHSDFAVGDPHSDGYFGGFDDDNYYVGLVTIVYGPFDPATSPYDVGAQSPNGLTRIQTVGGSVSGAGQTIAPVGDVNGDGFGDILLGFSTIQLIPGYEDEERAACLLFGTANPPPLVDIRVSGVAGVDAAIFRAAAPNNFAHFGFGFCGAGDADGDGFLDILIGAPADSYPDSSGRCYFVRGGTHLSGKDILLPWMDSSEGFAYGGAGLLGFLPSSVGDIDGDGFADGAVGGWLEESEERAVFVVRGDGANAPESAAYRSFLRSGAVPPAPIGVVGDGTDKETPWSRAWLGFDAGSGGGNGDASLVTTTLHRAREGLGQLPGPAAGVAWQIEADRTDWSVAKVAFRYTEAEAAGIDPLRLRIVRADAPEGPWELLDAGTAHDIPRRRIAAEASALGWFALVEEPPPPGDLLILQ